MALYRLRPISDRTPFTGVHVDAPFRNTRWTQTYHDLARELDFLQAKNVVLEVDFRERDLRLDGELRADARCLSPAVRLAFDSKHGPLQYATDHFDRPSWGGSTYPMTGWQYNVRAIALGLESLRRVDRYGITKRGEQYAGWKALPAGTAVGQSSHMTLEVAAHILVWEADDPVAGYVKGREQDIDDATVERNRLVRHLVGGSMSDQLRTDLLRQAKKNAHPDNNRGDRSRWDGLESAIEVLRRSGKFDD